MRNQDSVDSRKSPDRRKSINTFVREDYSRFNSIIKINAKDRKEKVRLVDSLLDGVKEEEVSSDSDKAFNSDIVYSDSDGEEGKAETEGHTTAELGVSSKITDLRGQEIAVSTIGRLNRISCDSGLLKNIAREDIRLVYTFVKKLGSGAYGSVRTAYKTVNPGKTYAIKSIKRDSFIGSEEDLKQELGILLSADHPNIVNLFEVYLDHEYIHFVTEVLGGGEVDPENEPSKRFSE